MNDKTFANQPASPVDQGRRRLCQAAIGGMAVAAVGTVSYPILTFLKLPKSPKQVESLEIALSELAEGSDLWGEHMGRQIVVIRTGGDVRAFDAACTHLGCIVKWDGASRTFKCPCHGAAFDDQGTPVSGPVNTPLRPVKFEVTDGVLKIV